MMDRAEPVYDLSATGAEIAEQVRLTEAERESLAACAAYGPTELSAGAVMASKVQQRLVAFGLAHPLFWFNDTSGDMLFSWQRTPAGEKVAEHFRRRAA